MYARIVVSLFALGWLAGCSSLLPKSKEGTADPWQSYQAAQEPFEKIVPGQTTIFELRQMSLDPTSNPNITILTYAVVMRKFMLKQPFSSNDRGTRVRECVLAKIGCRGLEINQSLVNKQRLGNVVLD